MKYKILILLTFLCLTYHEASATDISINTSGIIIDNAGNVISPGSINFTFDQSVLPVSIVTTAPPFCPGIIPQFASNPNFTISVSCPGTYCFSITTGIGTPDECCMDLCVYVPVCKRILVEGSDSDEFDYITTFCYEPVILGKGVGKNNDDIFLETSLDALQVSGNNEGSISATIYSKMEPGENLKIETIITETYISVLEELKATGETANLIKSQNEFKSDAPVVMKFNSNGELIWVYHNRIENNLSDYEIAESATTELLETQIQIGEVFPNPFNTELNVNLSSSQNKSVEVSLANMLGKLVLNQDFNLTQGDNNLHLDLDNIFISEGVFILMIRDNNGLQFSQKLVRIK